MVLYEDAQRDLYKTVMLPNGYYPAAVTMNVYESQGGQSFEYIDDWDNVYTKATIEEIMGQTWQGILIINRHMQMISPLGSDPMSHQHPKTRPNLVKPPNQILVHLPLVSKELVGRIGKSMNMLNIGETIEPPCRGVSVLIHAPSQPTGYY